MTAHLALVGDGVPVEAETLADQVRRLHRRTQDATFAHVDQLIVAVLRVAELGEEIAGGGEAYPAEVRDLARRLSQEGPVAARQIAATLRASRPPAGF